MRHVANHIIIHCTLTVTIHVVSKTWSQALKEQAVHNRLLIVKFVPKIDSIKQFLWKIAKINTR